MSMPEHGRAPGGGAQHGDHKAYGSRDTLGYEVGKAKARPRNTSVGGPRGTEAFTEAVLEFLENTKVGMVKEGVLNSDSNGDLFFLLYSFFLPFFPFFLSSPFTFLPFLSFPSVATVYHTGLRPVTGVCGFVGSVSVLP